MDVVVFWFVNFFSCETICLRGRQVFVLDFTISVASGRTLFMV